MLVFFVIFYLELRIIFCIFTKYLKHWKGACMNKIEILNNRLKKLYRYTTALNLINWDMLTHTPDSSIEVMVDTSAELSTRIMKMKTCNSMGKLLEELLSDKEFENLNRVEKETVKRLYKEYNEYKNVPMDFYEEYQRTIGKAQEIWAKAKNKNDYKAFKAYLEKMINMSKEMIKYRKPECEDIYNEMINDYEEGMNTEILDKLFSEIKNYVIPFMKRKNDGNNEHSSTKADSNEQYPINSQKKISEFLLRYIGFDLEKGIMGESEHPFTMSISYGDTRLTNHYYEGDFINPIFSIIHEGGHGIFEQNIDEKYKYTPMENINYLGLHESQSRFFENILGRNINFWKPIFEDVKKIMPEYKGSLEDFYNKINVIKPNLIRINSDEVSYCLHIILRYEIERDLFSGKLSVEELPRAWNDKMEEYLGIIPDNDSEGILQDSHWSGGNFGYFPTYLLGSIYDGMLLERIEEEIGSVDDILEKGEIKKITKWLNKHIHIHGSSIKPLELIETVCEKKITAVPLIEYFKKKYELE